MIVIMSKEFNHYEEDAYGTIHFEKIITDFASNKIKDFVTVEDAYDELANMELNPDKWEVKEIGDV